MSVETETRSMAEAQPVAQPAARPGSLYPWVLVGFLMILYTSSFIDRTILSLLVKPIRADLGITDTEISLLAGLSFTLFYTLAGIPCGWLADRMNRSHLIAAGVFVWSLLTASCGLAGTFWQLFIARLGVGVGEATLSPASYSLVGDTFPKEKLGRGLSIYGLGVPVGSGLALVIGGHVIGAIQEAGVPPLPLVGQLQPWQFVFMAIGLPGVLLAALTLLVVREPKRGKRAGAADAARVGETLAYIWQNKAVYSPIFLGMSFAALFSYGGNQWFPSYLQRVLGFTVSEAGQFMGYATLFLGIAGSLTAGYAADKLISRGHGDAHLRVGMVYGVGLLLCGALGPIMPEGPSKLLLALSCFFSITWVGINAAALQLVTPARMRGQVSAIYVFTTTLIGFGIGPTAVAFVTDSVFGYDQAVGKSLAVVGVVALTLSLLAQQLGRKYVAARVMGR